MNTRIAMPSRSRGAALLVAMMVAALAAAVAITLITNEQRWLASVGAQRDHAQAQALADAGVQWTRHILFQDAKQGNIDHLKEAWAYPLPPTPIENGSIEGQIIDMQSHFNLNNLLPDSPLKRAEYRRLIRLCAQAGIDDNVQKTLFAYHGSNASLNLGSVSGRDTSNAMTLPPLFDIGELALPPAALTKLAPHLVALPTPTPINVNTASRDTLKILFNDISDEDLSQFVALRQQKPFASMADFRRRLPKNSRIADETAIDVSSRYFMITVRARQGESRVQAQALLRRDGRHWPEIIWKTVE